MVSTWQDTFLLLYVIVKMILFRATFWHQSKINEFNLNVVFMAEQLDWISLYRCIKQSGDLEHIQMW